MKIGKQFGLLRKGSEVAVLACGYACLGLCFLIGYEVVARKLISHSIQGVDEIGGYVLAITGAFGFTYTLIHRTHTRIELGLQKFPAKSQAVLNTIAAICIAGFSGFTSISSFRALQESFFYNTHASTPLQTPLWLPQTVWFLGLMLFSVTALIMALHSILLLFKDHERANELYGPPTLTDEITSQVTEAKQYGSKGEGQ